jgi:formate-nitrite transporter family protein
MSDEPDEETKSEAAEAEERRSPSSRIVHETIVREGVEELERPSSALAWSALAGGLSMGFSLIAEAALQAHLPDTPWRPLVSKLGYSVGFLIVILGRQQLFTENTLTPILPLLEQRRPGLLGNVLRLWTIVLVGNLAGDLGIGWVLGRSAAVEPEVKSAMFVLAKEAVAPEFSVILLRAVFAGWLIALLVWLLPAAESARVWVIIAITYVIGLGNFSHVIAGSIEVFAAASAGKISWGEAFGGFTLPALIGNIIGGVTLVACINHAQVIAGDDDHKGSADHGD